MRKLAVIAAAVAVLALAAVAVGGATTSAQEGDGPIGTFLSKLADKLGVGEDELKDAIKEARSEMIDEAVDEGRLTEEQAERLKERLEEGGLLFPPPEEGRHRPRPDVCRRAVGLVVEAAAEVLDMPKDELVRELKDGSSLAQVAEGQGMGVGEFTEELLGQIETRLDDLVEDGKLTEEEAERIFQRTEENIERIVNAHPRPHGPCPPRHRPGPGFGPGPEGARHGPPPSESFDLDLSEVTA